MTGLPTRPKPMPRPPVRCSCIWSNAPTSGSVWMADQQCPASPHATWWQAPPTTDRPSLTREPQA